MDRLLHSMDMVNNISIARSPFVLNICHCAFIRILGLTGAREGLTCLVWHSDTAGRIAHGFVVNNLT